MNIAHVITRLIIGGAQENTLLTCRGLHARGHRVSLLVGPDAGPEGSLIEEVRADGYEICIIPSMHRAIQPLADFRARGELRRAFLELRPDVVHTHSSKAGVLGRQAAAEAHIPIAIHSIHGMSFNRTQPRPIRALYRWLERRAARQTDHFVTVADSLKAQAVSANIADASKFTTIYSGMQTEWYDPGRYDRAAVRRQWGFDEDHVVAASVARLFRNKGYEQLIPAMAEAVRQLPNLRFVWVGDGAHRSRYERQLETLGIRPHVHLTGLVGPRRVAELLAGADLLVHASQWEGLPRAAVQSLLMQVPVISFDIDGAPEVVVPDETGCLVPLNDIPALTAAIVRLAGDKSLRTRLGQSGRQRCLQPFDHNIMVDRIEELYKRLADEEGSSPSPPTAEP
jgi:glycosyltransferase involved in cell wall biosynthesis